MPQAEVESNDSRNLHLQSDKREFRQGQYGECGFEPDHHQSALESTPE
jgi:hypothetical protein